MTGAQAQSGPRCVQRGTDLLHATSDFDDSPQQEPCGLRFPGEWSPYKSRQGRFAVYPARSIHRVAGVKRGRYPSPIRPAHLAAFRRLKALVGPGPIRYGIGRRPGSALVPRPSCWAKLPDIVVCRDEECERRDEHLDGELSTGMREDIYGQAPRGSTGTSIFASSWSRPTTSRIWCVSGP